MNTNLFREIKEANKNSALHNENVKNLAKFANVNRFSRDELFLGMVKKTIQDKIIDFANKVGAIQDERDVSQVKLKNALENVEKLYNYPSLIGFSNDRLQKYRHDNEPELLGILPSKIARRVRYNVDPAGPVAPVVPVAPVGAVAVARSKRARPNLGYLKKAKAKAPKKNPKKAPASTSASNTSVQTRSQKRNLP